MIRKTGYLGLGVVLGAAAAVTAPQALLFVSPSAYAAAADTYRQLNLFGDVFDKIRNDYVEKPDEAKLIEAAINGMLTSLDPHSSYMDAKAFRDMQVQTKGEFGGLGIEVTQEDGLVKVVTPIDDTPAAKAGVMSGDIITAIDDQSTQGLTLDQAVDKMRGSINSPVKLKIVRGAEEGGQGLHDRPRSHPRPVGALACRGRRHRLHPHHPVHRADRRWPEGRDGEAAQRDSGRQVQGLHPRSAQQSGRLARPVDRRRQFLHRPWRDRLDARPQRRRDAAVRRAAGRRSLGRQAARRADQRRLGFGVGDRRPAPCRITSARR